MQQLFSLHLVKLPFSGFQTLALAKGLIAQTLQLKQFSTLHGRGVARAAQTQADWSLHAFWIL